MSQKILILSQFRKESPKNFMNFGQNSAFLQPK